MTGIRLNKYLAQCGVASRREADRIIEAGRVKINGRPAVLGDLVDGSEKVTVDGKPLGAPEQRIVVAFYKPVGVTVTEDDPHAEETVMDYIDLPERLTYAGRLDKDSEGLLIMTNDGDLIHEMMQGSHAHEKEYIVHLDKEPTQEMVDKLAKGVYLPEIEKKTKPCRVEKIGAKMVRMVLTEGLNREIRRMWNTENIRVRALKRIRIADITLGDLQPGEYSILSDEDVEKLKKSLAKERIKNNKRNLMTAKELKNTRSGMKRFNTNGPVHHKLAGGLEKKVKK